MTKFLYVSRYCKITTWIFLFFVLLFSGLKFSAFAQKDNDLVVCGHYRIIKSEKMGEERTLLISLPENYSKSEKSFPVIYKLDGEKGNFMFTQSSAFYLYDMTGETPDFIVVGIKNTNRRRDMSTDSNSIKFSEFLSSELIPFIESNYRTNGFRILAGQSQSAVFTLYTFLKQPKLFDAYILASFGIVNDQVANVFDETLKSNESLRDSGKRYLFVANGLKDDYDKDGSRTRRGLEFLETLRQNVSSELMVKTIEYPEEGHVPFPAVYEGLKWIFSVVSSNSLNQRKN